MSLNRREGDYFHNINKLNIIFAISSVVLLITVIGMIWADHSREWKVWQRKFNDLEIAKTRAEIEQAARRIDEDKLKQLRKDLESARSTLKQKEEEYEVARERLRNIDVELYKVDRDLRISKAVYDAQKYEYEKLAHEDSSKAQDGKIRLDEMKAQLDELGERATRLTLEKEEAERRVKQFTSRRDEIIRKIGALEKEKAHLEKKLERIRHSLFGDYFRNRPIVDFMNPSIKIQQIVLKDLHDDINFTTIPKVDRCTTCHLAIDQKGYEEEDQPFRTHSNLDLYLGGDSPHPMERFGCTICHQGRGRGTSFTTSTHTPGSREQRRAWKEKHNWRKLKPWDDPMLPLEYTQASCLKCHKGVIEVHQADRLNRGLELIEQLGCYGCHSIRGFEGLRRPGPDLTRIASKLDRDWTFKWIKDPKAFRPTTTMPKSFNLSNSSTPEDSIRSDVEIGAIAAYLYNTSERINYPKLPFGGDVERGREIVQGAGCLACHVVGEDPDGRGSAFGPNLSGIGDKMDETWLYSWVREPRSYDPETNMPDLRLTEREASDVVAYLLSLKGESSKDSLPEPNTQVLDEAVLEFLRRRLTDKQAKGRLASMSEDEKSIFLGERLIRRYGCFGCHKIKGFEKAQPIGIDLSEEGSIYVDQLDFGFTEMEHTRWGWLLQKLKDPRIFDVGRIKRPGEKLVMPDFGLSDEDAKAIVTALLGFTKENVSLERQRRLSRREAAVEEGRKVIKRSNCRGCHVIEGRGGDIAPVITEVMVGEGRTKAEAKAFLPPPLDGEGEKVQPEWLFNFMKHPSLIRPWLRVRMPNYHFSDKEATALVKYFSELAEQELYQYVEEKEVPEDQLQIGEQIFDLLKCISCHPSGGEQLDIDVESLAPDLSLAKRRLKPNWILRWLKDPQSIEKGTKMPTNWPKIRGRYYLPPSLKKILGGDVDKQVEVLRDYLLTLGD